MVFDHDALDNLLESVSEAYPSEGCGLLLGSMNENRVRSVYTMKNLVGRERDLFEMDPLSVYEAECQAEKEGNRIVGFYHSHPDAPAIPSPQDEDHMIPGMLYVILSVWERKTRGIRAYKKQNLDGDMVSVPVSIMEEPGR